MAGAALLFARHGFDGTSVDDLVRGLGIHRGSPYSTFGSKRALYLRVLPEHVDHLPAPTADGHGPFGDVTLLLRAALERAPVDAEAAAMVRRGLSALGDHLTADGVPPADAPTTLAQVLGEELIRRATGPTEKETS